MHKNQLLLQMSYCIKTAKNSKALSLKYKVRQCRLHRDIYSTIHIAKSKHSEFYSSIVLCGLNSILFSSRVKRTPQDFINELNIQKSNPLVVVNVRFISAFLHA